MTAERIESRLRHGLMMLAMLAMLATLADLWLHDHANEPLQLIPYILCGAGLIALATVLFRPEKSTLLALRGVMTIVALGGLLGVVIHLWRNLEFEQEIRPNAAMSDLLIHALKGASPALAPGVMVFASLVALAATYAHPAFGERKGMTSDE